jgi:hypothetical protein
MMLLGAYSSFSAHVSNHSLGIVDGVKGILGGVPQELLTLPLMLFFLCRLPTSGRTSPLLIKKARMVQEPPSGEAASADPEVSGTVADAACARGVVTSPGREDPGHLAALEPEAMPEDARCYTLPSHVHP